MCSCANVGARARMCRCVRARARVCVCVPGCVCARARVSVHACVRARVRTYVRMRAHALVHPHFRYTCARTVADARSLTHALAHPHGARARVRARTLERATGLRERTPTWSRCVLATSKCAPLVLHTHTHTPAMCRTPQYQVLYQAPTKLLSAIHLYNAPGQKHRTEL